MKIIFSLLLILTTTLVAFGQPKDRQDQIFDSLLVIGNYDEIIDYFEKELLKQPKSEAILRKLGYVYILVNDFDRGKKYYLDALTINPKCGRCYINIGRIYALKEEYKVALGYFEKAIAADPTDGLLFSNRAQLKEMMGDQFGASRDYDKAIELDSANSESYISRAQYNLKAGYPSLALADFTKAIELSPFNKDAYFERAIFHYQQKRLDEALVDANKAIELDRVNYRFYIGRGAILNEMKDYKKAIADYDKAISLNKSDYLSYLNRASSYYQLEDLDASCVDYEYLKSQIEKGNLINSEIIKEVNGAVQDICDPSKPSYFYQRGIAFYNLTEYEKAIEIYTEGLVIFPDNAMMLSFKGNAYLALNEYQKALDAFDLSLNNKENYIQEIKINPRYTEASTDELNTYYQGSLASIYFSISQCKVNMGNFDAALKDVNMALELAPSVKDFNIETYYNLRGYIYLMKRQYNLAIVDFDKSIHVNKSFSMAYVNRAIAKVSMAEKVKIYFHSLRGNLSNQPLNLNWNSPTKSSLKKSENTLLSALADCNLAIEMETDFGFAYYIRGQIKLILGQSDFCLDLMRAAELGLLVEQALVKDCK